MFEHSSRLVRDVPGTPGRYYVRMEREIRSFTRFAYVSYRMTPQSENPWRYSGFTLFLDINSNGPLLTLLSKLSHRTIR